MKLSPLEIKKQEFDRGFRGYDVEEVQAFLQTLASQWENMLEENRRLEEQVRDYKNKITHYEKVEEALQDALDSARETAKQKVLNAEEKARNLIDDAERRAERIQEEAYQDRHQMKREVTQLKHRREEIVTRLRAFLTSEVEILNQYEDDPEGFIELLPYEEKPKSISEGAQKREKRSSEPSPSQNSDHQNRLSAREDNSSEQTRDLRKERASADGKASAEALTGSFGQQVEGQEKPGDHDRQEEQTPSDRSSASSQSGANESKQGWRVHSVVSSSPDKAEEEQPQQAKPEQKPAEKKEKKSEKVNSSKEMDKIRRILDELD